MYFDAHRVREAQIKNEPCWITWTVVQTNGGWRYQQLFSNDSNMGMNEKQPSRGAVKHIAMKMIADEGRFLFVSLFVSSNSGAWRTASDTTAGGRGDDDDEVDQQWFGK